MQEFPNSKILSDDSYHCLEKNGADSYVPWGEKLKSIPTFSAILKKKSGIQPS